MNLQDRIWEVCLELEEECADVYRALAAYDESHGLTPKEVWDQVVKDPEK